MKETWANTVLAYERPAKSFTLVGFDAPFESAKSMALAGAGSAANVRAWIGDVFFDHVRQTIDAAPAILCEAFPFILVCHWADFDWTGQDHTTVTTFTDASELVLAATKQIDEALAAGRGSCELWEVYGVRVRIFES